MADRKDRIAELYFESGTVQFGEFYMSIHRDHPELPPSPYYAHYPKKDEPGNELLPLLYYHVGAEFYDMTLHHDPPLNTRRIAGLPRGAWPLAYELSKYYDNPRDRRLKFEKIESGNRLSFELLHGEYNEGDSVQLCEDHITAARNNLLFVEHVRNIGLEVMSVLCVLDRQQGGRDNLAMAGVEMISIFTDEELLDRGRIGGFVTAQQCKIAAEYRALNVYDLDDLRSRKGA